MDPVSIIGLVRSVVSIVNTLCTLQTKYRKANLTVSLLIGQLSTLKAALNQISEWIDSELNTPKHEQLVEDLAMALQGCQVLISLLDSQADDFREDEGTGKLSALGKVVLLWDESEMKEYLGHLNNQISALNLLLTAIQCRSTFEQNNILSSNESRHIMTLVKEDTSSLLLVIGDADSSRTERTVLTGNSKSLDVTFDFDGEIFNSKVYHGALRSNMMQNLFQTRNIEFMHGRKPISGSNGALLGLDSPDYSSDSTANDAEKYVKQIIDIEMPESGKHLDIAQTADNTSIYSDSQENDIQKNQIIKANEQIPDLWEEHKDDIITLFKAGMDFSVIHKRVRSDEFRISERGLYDKLQEWGFSRRVVSSLLRDTIPTYEKKPYLSKTRRISSLTPSLKYTFLPTTNSN